MICQFLSSCKSILHVEEEMYGEETRAELQKRQDEGEVWDDELDGCYSYDDVDAGEK